MLEIPPEWNAVPDLIMDDKDEMMITETDTKLKGRGNSRRKMIYALRNANIHPCYLGEHKTKQDSIQRIGMNSNKKKMNWQRGFTFYRWCFVVEV